MNAPDRTFPATLETGKRSSEQSLSMQWAALQEAGTAVATLARIAPERPSPEIRNFPALIKDAGGWRFEMAHAQVGDLAAMMRPGLSALLAVNARGQDAATPALTLWREFTHARDAILALVPESGAMGPRRSA